MTHQETGPTLTSTANSILQSRYYLKDNNGVITEDWKALCDRVSTAIAFPDKRSKSYEIIRKKFFDMIYHLDFLPNSPCLMNAGTGIGQLSACFVLPIEDSMDSIFTSVKNGALVHKTGGGTGYSFSKIRAKNSPVNTTQGVASGPLSFAAVFDAATETIKQGGKRRGANMGVLRVDHPDILEFIDAKEDQTKFNNFNFSVALTHTFMEAVRLQKKYDLYEPSTGDIVCSIDANEVFDKIIDGAWRNGEPGVLFIDTANAHNPTPHLGDFEATNPCGEQFLLPMESCNLGSINLSRFISSGEIDYERLKGVVHTAVRFLDNVVECNVFPIPEIEVATKQTRKIGLGIMGLHDMLILLGLSYGSDEGRYKASEVMQFIRDEAEEASIVLATTHGTFPAWNPEYVQYAPRRNAALTSIQPTGTVSMIADCASGCEPYFSVVTKKTVMDGTEFILVNPFFEKVARENGFFSYELMKRIADTGTIVGQDDIPKKYQQIFASAQDIYPEDHIRMQSILQNSGVDSSISKTINLPASATKEHVKDAYLQGFYSGCKGLTVYRDGSRAGQVLSTTNSTDALKSVSTQKEELHKMDLPDTLNAKRYRLKDTNGGHIYIIVCFDDSETPIEVFANFAYDNSIELRDKATMWTTVCRLVSLSLRCRIPVEEIINQLERSSGQMLDLPAQLSKLLKSFMAGTQKGFYSKCPQCTGRLIYEEGCECCKECGFSKCS